MKKWLKRIRGALGMGLTWAAVWAGVGAIFPLVLTTIVFGADQAVAGWLNTVGIFTALFAVLGLGAGAGFSVVLGIAEGRRRFDEMSLPRFAAGGAVGGLLLWGIMAGLWGGRLELVSGLAISFTLLGAGSAAGSLALARRADDRELLEAGPDVADMVRRWPSSRSEGARRFRIICAQLDAGDRISGRSVGNSLAANPPQRPGSSSHNLEVPHGQVFD